MAATSTNFIITYKGCGQVYGTASEETAMASPPPKGYSPEDKRIFFISHDIDEEKLTVYELDKSEVFAAAVNAVQLKEAALEEKKKAKKDD